MLTITMEQRIVIKFYMKLGKTATEIHDLLKEVYGNECLSRARVFDCYKRFEDGLEDVEDDLCSDPPSMPKKDDNIEKIDNLIRSDRRISIRAIAEIVGINKETVRQILHNNFNMQKVCAKMVPKTLTFEQQEARKNICADILNAMENEPNLLERIIICDESWFFSDESVHGKSKFKAMMIVFFDIHGIVYLHWVPEAQIVNQQYYLHVLAELRERIMEERPVLWKDKSWIIYQDDAPSHSALSVKRFLAKYNIPLLDYPAYSPDLAPCDFFLFPKVISALSGIKFESDKAMKEKAESVLKELTEEDFQNCFKQWETRMKRCRNGGGVNIEDDNQ